MRYKGLCKNVTNGCRQGRKAFYNLPTFGHWQEIKKTAKSNSLVKFKFHLISVLKLQAVGHVNVEVLSFGLPAIAKNLFKYSIFMPQFYLVYVLPHQSILNIHIIVVK